MQVKVKPMLKFQHYNTMETVRTPSEQTIFHHQEVPIVHPYFSLLLSRPLIRHLLRGKEFHDIDISFGLRNYHKEIIIYQLGIYQIDLCMFGQPRQVVGL